MNYYVKRVGQAVLTLLVVVTLTFALYRLMPGGPVQMMQSRLIGQMEASGQAVNERMVERMVNTYTGFDPNQPIHIAYYQYIRDIVLYQDFGQSIQHQEPVFVILFKALPWSVFVSVYGLILGYSGNLFLGAFMAYKEGSHFDNVSSIGAIVLNSIPYYVGGILMLSYLGFNWGLFPTGGRYPQGMTPGFNIPFMLGVVHHAALPIASGFIVGFGGAALEMRGNSIRVMGENYLRVARLRGLSESRIAIRYVGRNSILPLYTKFMIGIAAIFSSSIVMEQIFRYPGMGWYTFDALALRDYPLLMGVLLLFSTVTVTGVLIADLTYGLIDPRAGQGDQEAY